jgi:hypothetical protein
LEFREILGRRARDEQELLEAIEEIPLDSIYYHTHSYFLRHKYVSGLYPNDFATWAATHVGDRVLGEKLSVIDPFGFTDLEPLRSEILTILSDHIASLTYIPRVIFGEPFYFIRSRVLQVPTDLEVHTLEGFRDALAQVHVSALYFHVFEARVRLGRKRGDFAIWFEEGLGMKELVGRMDFDPYMFSLEGLRNRVISLCDEFLTSEPKKDRRDRRP